MLSLPTLSLYIHFPWCVHKCPYCDFNSHVFKTDIPEKAYIDALLKDLQHDLVKVQDRPIQSIYLGGGTPSLFNGTSIQYLFQQLRQMVRISKTAEISMEMNPESVVLANLYDYQEAGVNRASLGVQSFQDSYLKKLGRAHDSQRAYQAIETIITSGFSNFNLDIMYGLPGQTIVEGLKDVQAALKIHPPHFSWYQLTIESGTAFFKKPPHLPKEDGIVTLQQAGSLQITEAGLSHYEISAFSQPGLYSRHNCHYWAFDDYIGIGAGAHSKVTLANDGIMRYWKWSNPRRYLSEHSFVEGSEKIAMPALPFEFMLNRLRLYQPIEKASFETRTGLSWDHLKPALIKGAAKELLVVNDQSFSLTTLGHCFYNDVVALFL